MATASFPAPNTRVHLNKAAISGTGPTSLAISAQNGGSSMPTASAKRSLPFALLMKPMVFALHATEDMT